MPAPVRSAVSSLAPTSPITGLLSNRQPRNPTKADAAREAPWSPDRLLADATHMNDAYVSLAMNPVTGDLYAVFEATDLGGTDRDIHIARSQDDGQTWTLWDMPSFTQDESMPDIAIDAAGFLHVVWVRDDGYIVRTRSQNAGDPTSWAWIKGLFTDSINATPSVAVTGSGDFATLFIAASYQEINWDLMSWEWTLIWMWSTNAGNTISFDALVPDGFPDLWPDVAMSGGLVHLINGEASVWGDPTNILLASDAISGGFANVTNLTDWTDFSTGFPRVACEGDAVYTVFQHDWDDGLGNIDGDIVYHLSYDAGQTVFGPYEMIGDEYESVGPTIAVSGGVVSCQWIEAAPNDDQFHVAARQAGGAGHPDLWPDVVEVVTDQDNVEPQYHFLDAAVGARIHSVWIDRRDTPTQGHNVYTSERSLRPDLAATTPVGWGGSLIASSTIGERSQGWLRADAPAYLSFALANTGLADATRDIRVTLAIDGAPAGAWTLTGGLAVNTSVVVEDFEVTLGGGPHVIEVVLDSLDAINEEDETNNLMIAQWIWLDGDPCLRFSVDHVAHFETAPLKHQADALAARPPVLMQRHIPVLSPRLQAELLVAAVDQRWPVIVVPSRRLDHNALAPRLHGLDADLRRATVVAAARIVLTETAAELGVDKSNPEMRELWLPGMLALQLTAAEILALADDPGVGRLWLDDRANRTFTADGRAATPTGINGWHLGAVGADEAWNRGFDGGGVLVGHIDSGAAYDHPDLAGHLWNGGLDWPHHGWDAIDQDNDPYEGDATFGHGTHTAGLVVGDGDAGQATGAAPGAELMILRAVPGYFSDMVEVMQFALDHGPVDLFTMSAGWDAPSSDLKAANRDNAEILLIAGIPWVCAAGNGDNLGGHHPVPSDIASPGDCPNPGYGDAGRSAVITVGAIDATDTLWPSSSLGPTSWNISETAYTDYLYPPGLIKPDLAAPGVGVTSLTPTGGYVTYSGTSMAAPLVAGAVAILKQASPGANPAEIAEALEVGAADLGTVGRDPQTGAGRLDIPGSLDALVSVARETVVLYNDGPLPLHLGPISWQASWLSVSIQSMTVLPGDSTRVLLDFDVTGLPSGLDHDTVSLESDDPSGPHHLTITLAIGDVTGVDGPPANTADLAGVPNPFNPRTELRFNMVEAGKATLVIMDLRGRKVRTLIDGRIESGVVEVRWDGSTDDGRALPGGVYLARLTTPGDVLTTKLTLLR